ncbi:MAG: condensation domain-containing protein, partial [Pseudomonadota bacterium]
TAHLARAETRIRISHALAATLEDRNVPVVTFSSVNGYFGGTGFREYAAACGYQSALAQRASASGSSNHVCLDWSMWKQVGMAAGASADIRALARRRGFDSMSPAQALASLHVAVDRDEPYALIGLYAGGDAVLPLLEPGNAVYRLDVSGTQDAAAVARMLGVDEDRVECRHDDSTKVNRRIPEAQLQALLGVFRDILVKPDLLPDDNFFANGGDSIRAIQVVTRASEIGIEFRPLDLFEHTTVRALLSNLAETNKLHTPDPEEELDDDQAIALPPIFSWWLENTRAPEDRNHFSMSMRYRLRPGIGADEVKNALIDLVAAHAALRLRLLETDEGWRLAADGDVERSLLMETHARAQDGEVERRLHEALDIHDGPIVGASCLEAAGDEAGQLVLVIHHAAVDGVSWRILEEELRGLLEAPGDGAAAPRAKTAGFMHWAHRAILRAQNADGEAMADAWMARLQGPGGRLPEERDRRELLEASTCIYSRRVPIDTLSRVGDAGLHELLLTAVGWSLGEWIGQPGLVIDVEGHGRLNLDLPIDISRTMGWFTSITPLRLDFTGCAKPGEAVHRTRAALEEGRGKDLEWGMLRHLGVCPESHPLAALPERQISFNYLGSFDTTEQTEATLAAIPDSLGAEQAPSTRRRYLIDIAAQATGAELEISVKYSPECHSADEVATWMNSCERVLRDLLGRPANLGLDDDDMLAALGEVAFG